GPPSHWRPPGTSVLSFPPRAVHRRRRHSLAFLVSLVGHTVAVGGFAPGFAFRCVPEFEVPEIDPAFSEVELLDPDALRSEDEQPEPVAPAEPPPAPPPEPPPPTPEDPESEEQKPPP